MKSHIGVNIKFLSLRVNLTAFMVIIVTNKAQETALCDQEACCIECCEQANDSSSFSNAHFSLNTGCFPACEGVFDDEGCEDFQNIVFRNSCFAGLSFGDPESFTIRYPRGNDVFEFCCLPDAGGTLLEGEAARNECIAVTSIPTEAPFKSPTTSVPNGATLVPSLEIETSSEVDTAKNRILIGIIASALMLMITLSVLTQREYLYRNKNLA